MFIAQNLSTMCPTCARKNCAVCIALRTQLRVGRMRVRELEEALDLSGRMVAERGQEIEFLRAAVKQLTKDLRAARKSHENKE